MTLDLERLKRNVEDCTTDTMLIATDIMRELLAMISSLGETDHVVRFGERGFTVIHPIQERLGGLAALAACSLHQWIERCCWSPVAEVGDYHAVEDGEGGWSFTPVQQEVSA